MKAGVVGLSGALVLTLAGAGVLGYREVRVRHALEARLGEAEGEVAQFRSQLGDTSSKLQEANATITRTSADLARVNEDLAHTKAESVAVAGMQARLLKITGLANAELADAWEQAGAAQQALVDHPTGEAFANLTAAVGRAQAQVSACRQATDEFDAFVKNNEAMLAPAGEQVATARARLAEAKGQFDEIAAKLEATGKSLRESKFSAMANEGWASTDLSVAEGEVVAVSASGQWRWSRGPGGVTGPEGDDGNPGLRLAPQLPNGALIARVRGSGFVHRALGGIQPDRAGRLELRINDTAGADNDGSVDVVMWAFRPLQ